MAAEAVAVRVMAAISVQRNFFILSSIRKRAGGLCARFFLFRIFIRDVQDVADDALGDGVGICVGCADGVGGCWFVITSRGNAKKLINRHLVKGSKLF